MYISHPKRPPSRSWSAKGEPFDDGGHTWDHTLRGGTAHDDTDGLALHVENGVQALTSDGRETRTWDDTNGPMVEPPEDRAIEQRALAILERLDPEAADVMRRQGQRVSDRRAADTQRATDMVEASHEISAAKDWTRTEPSYAELEQRRYPWLADHEHPGPVYADLPEQRTTDPVQEQ